MITDIFARRYEEVVLRPQYYLEDNRFLNQAAVMLMDPLWSGRDADEPSATVEAGLKRVHDTVALELGREWLSDRWWWSSYTFNGNAQQRTHTNSYATIVKAFLVKIPEDKAKGDLWVKERLSLVEVAFRLRAEQISNLNQHLPRELMNAERDDKQAQQRHGLAAPGNRASFLRLANKRANDAFAASVAELNERMRIAGYSLHYHNGFIQIADDEVLKSQVAEPFWLLVAEPQFANVDLQIKEAIDRRDKGDRTAAFHAVCALESCIKVISDLKGWTRGNEKGAAAYVDNLVSKANGRFLEVWEGELLTKMFGDVRNPFAHGPGQDPMPQLTPEQTDWALDTSMSWCKSLIRRM